MEGRKEKERAWLLKIDDLDQTLLIVLQEKHFLKSVRESVQDLFAVVLLSDVGRCFNLV